MKVLHINASACDGSGKAVSRQVQALGQAGTECEFVFWRPYHHLTARINSLERKLNGLVNKAIHCFFDSCSLNIFPTSLLKVINRSDADIVHLHWINAEMISIGQLRKINKPVVWTFHDMWPICGIEHSVLDNRFETGCFGKIGAGVGLKKRIAAWLDGWIWRRKQKAYSNFRFSVVTPSFWLSDCVRKSPLFDDVAPTVVANCLDLSVYRPLGKKEDVRHRYGIPRDKRAILLVCSEMTVMKGVDLLRESLEMLAAPASFVLIILGTFGNGRFAELETVWLGRKDTDAEVAEIYNSADVVCVPSLVESFGQTASESQACGVPVVAFGATGIMDVVEHKVTGYLAQPYDAADFSKGIQWVLDHDLDEIGRNARIRAETLWSGAIAAKQLRAIYDQVLQKLI